MDPDELLKFAEELIELAAKRGVTLRLLGHLAVRNHVRAHRTLIDLMKRLPTHDIDFMGYSKETSQANRFFIDELGYAPDPAVANSQEFGIQRLMYYRPDGLLAEIFLDDLHMAHTIKFKNRLELDYPTISLVDLMLSKLQIVEINEKDIKDIIVLLVEHSLGSGDREKMDVDYLAHSIQDDWGLYYTANINLNKVRAFIPLYEALGEPISKDVNDKIDQIIHHMEATPKSLKWKMRAKVGPRVKWYEDVSDVHR